MSRDDDLRQIREATVCLNSPPHGGIVRQNKPWEAIGISRATWYRRGKPTEKPPRRGQGPFSQRKMAAGNRVSLRTQQRLDRIMEFDGYGPKPDGTYVVEFETADGDSLAISVPAGETRVLKHFQARMPFGLFVPDAET